MRSGAELIICPVRRLKGWKEFFERGPWVSEDFMSERVDPPPQERDFPDRDSAS
jgi:virulence-associated protein VagC